MGLRPGSAYAVAHYMTHRSRAQISIDSCIVSTTSYRMEQVLCQASQRHLGDEDIGQGSAKAYKFVYVTFEQGGDQPSIIGSFSADGRSPRDSRLTVVTPHYPTASWEQVWRSFLES